jgi:hypothetical protein
VIVVGQGLGCGFAVNAAEAAAGFGGFVIDAVAEFENAKPQAFGEVRQFLSADEDEHQGEDEDDLTAAEIEQSKEAVHPKV